MANPVEVKTNLVKTCGHCHIEQPTINFYPRNVIRKPNQPPIVVSYMSLCRPCHKLASREYYKKKVVNNPVHYNRSSPTNTSIKDVFQNLNASEKARLLDYVSKGIPFDVIAREFGITRNKAYYFFKLGYQNKYL